MLSIFLLSIFSLIFLLVLDIPNISLSAINVNKEQKLIKIPKEKNIITGFCILKKKPTKKNIKENKKYDTKNT